MTATEPSISHGTAGIQNLRVIAYPLGEHSNETVMVSTKARKRVGCGWPFSFAWRSPCPRVHFSHRTSQPRSFQPLRTRRSSEIPSVVVEFAVKGLQFQAAHELSSPWWNRIVSGS
jgi:hypothetical protein